MKKIYFLWSLLGLLTLHMGWVQTNITGTVNDETGAPLPGATVITEGTSIVVATDFDGNFTIEASQGETLLITYVGCADQRITVGSDDSYNITMELNSALEEIIVTGQGSGIERRKLSTTVDVLLEKDIGKLPATHIDQLLQASTPSAQIRLSSGQPGTASIIRTRGPISAVTEYTCTGNSTIETISTPQGTSRLLFTYTAGDWEGENLYTLSDPSGTLILSDGTGDGSRTNGPGEGEQYNTCD